MNRLDSDSALFTSAPTSVLFKVKSCILILLMLNGLLSILYAQQDSIVTESKRIRVTLSNNFIRDNDDYLQEFGLDKKSRIVGNFFSLHTDSIILDFDNQSRHLSVPLSDVQKLEVVAGQKSNTGKATLIGLAGGAALGIVVGLAAAKSMDLGMDAVIIYGAGGGAVAGALIGGVIGSNSHSEFWKETNTEQLIDLQDTKRFSAQQAEKAHPAQTKPTVVFGAGVTAGMINSDPSQNTSLSFSLLARVPMSRRFSFQVELSPWSFQQYWTEIECNVDDATDCWEVTRSYSTSYRSLSITGLLHQTLGSGAQLYGGGGFVREMDEGGGDSGMRLSGGIEKSVNQTFGVYLLTTYDLKVVRNQLKITIGTTLSI